MQTVPPPVSRRGSYRIRPYLPLMALTTIIWGAAFPITKPGLAEMPPATFAVVRFIISVSILLPVLFLIRKGWHIPRRVWWKIALAGFLGFSFAQLGQNWALTFSPASDIAILASTEPLSIALLAAYFLKEKPGGAVWLGLAISMTGVLIVIRINPFALFSPTTGGGEGDQRILGDLAFLVGMLGFASYNVLTRSLTQKYNGLEVTTGALIFGTVGLLPFSLFELIENPKAPQFTQTVWVGLLYSAFLVTIFGFLALSWSIKRIPAARVALLFYLQPVSGVLISWLGGEQLTLNFGLGAALILAGVFIAEHFSGSLQA